MPAVKVADVSARLRSSRNSARISRSFELDLLRHYANVFGKGSRYHYYIFALGGFTEPLLECGKRGEVTLLTLNDLY